MAVRGNKANPLHPEPFGVYAWMLLLSMIAMGGSIYLICKELIAYYGWNSDQLWEVCVWLFNLN